jgi:hypothetical protein
MLGEVRRRGEIGRMGPLEPERQQVIDVRGDVDGSG